MPEVSHDAMGPYFAFGLGRVREPHAQGRPDAAVVVGVIAGLGIALVPHLVPLRSGGG